MTRKINYPKRRSPPRQHTVKAHKRKGKSVRTYKRGKGQRAPLVKSSSVLYMRLPVPKTPVKKRRLLPFRAHNLSKLDKVDREIVKAVVAYGNKEKEDPMELWGQKLVNYVYGEVTEKLGYNPIEKKMDDEGYDSFETYVDWTSEWAGEHIKRN